MKKLFRLSKKVAAKNDCRQYRFGAVGIRKDGTIVISRNIPTRCPEPRAHAESRIARKLNKGSIIYVIRIDRKNNLTMARPCKSCQRVMLRKGVKKVYYSINPQEYGVIVF